jgi:hypothetical protein
MSWDISVVASPAPPPLVEQLPRDWRGEVLGSQAEVREKISTVLPETDWRDPTWGIFEGDGFSLEFNMGSEEPSDGFMIHVRGGGPAVTNLLRLAELTGWYLLDCSQGEWLHHCKDPEAGWVGFQAFRDKVFSRMHNQGEAETGLSDGRAMGNDNPGGMEEPPPGI